MPTDDPTAGIWTCLGVAAGSPCHERRHSAYLLQQADTSILFDAGVGVSAAIAGLRLAPDAVGHVFLSHQHSDHVGGFSMLIQGWWVLGRRRPLTVHASAQAIPAIRAWLQATLLFEELIGFRILWEPLIPGAAVRVDGFEVRSFPTTHLGSLERSFAEGYPAVAFEAFSFLIEGPQTRVAHSADIGAVADLEPLLRGRLDLLVCEVSHVEPEDLFRRLAQVDISRIILIHLERRWWEDQGSLRSLAQAHLPGREIHIARDGDRYRIG